MTATERSEVLAKLRNLITELNDLASESIGTSAQEQLELAQHHLNRTAMILNRIRVQDSVQMQFTSGTSGFPTT